MRSLLVIVASVVALAVPPAAAALTPSYLSNSSIRVGVDLDEGGAITFLAPATGGESVINDYDLGRQAQQSYYSGPEGLCFPGATSVWNPTGAGDRNGNPSLVVAHTNDGATIYVRSIPRIWTCDDVACECTFEQWITLDGNAVHVRNRLTNSRSDRTQYAAFPQELPAVYTTGKLHRLFTYSGAEPYTGAPPSQIMATLPGAAQWTASERWAAYLNSGGWGLGVFNPSVTTFVGGFHGTPGTGGPNDDPTGYVSPTRKEILDWNIAYEYEYALVLGTLDEIRAYAVAHRPDGRPDFRFASDRQGWWYINAGDAGYPSGGALRVKLDLADPQMWRLEQWFQAAEVPKLYIRAAHRSNQNQAEVFWQIPGAGFSETRRVQFGVKPDGRYHTYAVDLASSPAYNGTITGLRFDPVFAAEGGAYVDVASISWKQARRNLSVTPHGLGSIASEPAGISCPPTCSASFGEGATVTLDTAAGPGWAFSVWGGACSDVAGCVVTLDDDAAVEATFVPAVHERRISLSISRRGLAQGRVAVPDGHTECAAAVPVQLQRKAGKRWRLAKRATTALGGSYRVKLPKSRGTYRAFAPKTQDADHACLAAVSRTRRRR